MVGEHRHCFDELRPERTSALRLLSAAFRVSFLSKEISCLLIFSVHVTMKAHRIHFDVKHQAFKMRIQGCAEKSTRR